MSKYVAFSIDNVMDPMVCIQFKGWWDGMSRNLEVLGNLVQCIGKYKDDVEYSFITLYSDFEKVVEAGWVNNQESVLLFSENNNQAATLRYLDGSPDEVVGHLQYVDKHRALANPDGWSYRPDLDKYWIITVTQDELKRRAAYEAWKALDSGVYGNPFRAEANALAAAFGFGRTKRAVDFHMSTSADGTAFTITAKES